MSIRCLYDIENVERAHRVIRFLLDWIFYLLNIRFLFEFLLWFWILNGNRFLNCCQSCWICVELVIYNFIGSSTTSNIHKKSKYLHKTVILHFIQLCSHSALFYVLWVYKSEYRCRSDRIIRFLCRIYSHFENKTWMWCWMVIMLNVLKKNVVRFQMMSFSDSFASALTYKI